MQSNTLRDLLDKWPGKKYLGVYRFLPIFFALGAALEFSMINWKVGSTNFCKTWLYMIFFLILVSSLIFFLFIADSTFKKRQADNLAKKALGLE